MSDWARFAGFTLDWSGQTPRKDPLSTAQDVLAGTLVLITVAIAGRYAYRRLYLRRRLFVEPLTNLSRDEQFNTGEALAELLLFEIDRLKWLLNRATSEDGLWNERLALPLIERSADGYGRLLDDANLLGLPSRLNKLVEFVLRTRPQSLRGNIQKYGPNVRLQLRLDGVKSSDSTRVRAWATTIKADQPELIPEAMNDLAHQVLRDLCHVQGFKSPEAFRAFTSALRHHLDHTTVSRSTALEAAIREYRLAIQYDGSNALAACNLGDLLYAQYSYESNELAIDAFTFGLNTDNFGQRARAFRGLANAYSQKYQRYRCRDAAILDKAIQAAHGAGRLCDAGAGLTDKEVASIRKAQAYAHQVSAEQPGLNENGREEALDLAKKLYKEATHKSPTFPIPFNNLSYLCLERAKALHVAAKGNGERVSQVLELLSEAAEHCAGAINGDRTYYLAYDNRGNIARLRARVEAVTATNLLRDAIQDYHEALSYRPTYEAALGDLAKAHVQLYWLLGAESGRDHAELGWHYHWESLGCTKDDGRRRALCEDFAKRRRPMRPATAVESAVSCHCASEGATL